MSGSSQILIVEDELIIAMDLQETLTQQGFAIMGVVPSGEQALELCQTSQPDLVLLDNRLQGKLSGLETARLLRQRYALPAVLLTAYFDQQMLQAAAAAELFGYLIKPFEERELCATLTTALQRARSEQELRQALRAVAVGVPVTNAGGEGLQIRTFGFPLELRLGQYSVSGEQLTRVQRELLGLLLAAPDFKLDQEELTAELWPDSTPDRARSTLDSNLLRLRRLLQEGLQNAHAKDHLTVRKGIVALDACSVDLTRFRQLEQSGRELRRHGQLTTAKERLEAACALWQGEFLSGMTRHERVLAVRQQTTQTFLDLCQQLAATYLQEGRLDEGIALCHRGLAVEVASEPLTSRLYALLLRQGQTVRAGQLLQGYEKVLLNDGVGRGEILASLCRIKQPAA